MLYLEKKKGFAKHARLYNFVTLLFSFTSCLKALLGKMERETALRKQFYNLVDESVRFIRVNGSIILK